MNFNEKIDLHGEVLIVSTDISGKSEILVDDKNLIVLSGRSNVASGLSGTSPGYINAIVFGTGGAAPSTPSLPIAVSPSETTVISPITGLLLGSDYTFTLIDTSLAPTPRVQFSITIPTTSAGLNGKGINEAALMLNTSPAKAFAIKRFATITKSSSISITITWTIFV